jgi:hypothetical protein
MSDAIPVRPRVVIGSRDSELAMKQSTLVVGMLRAAHPGVEFEIQSTSSLGDKDLTKPLAQLAAGCPGLFTKELEVGRPSSDKLRCLLLWIVCLLAGCCAGGGARLVAGVALLWVCPLF